MLQTEDGGGGGDIGKGINHGGGDGGDDGGDDDDYFGDADDDDEADDGGFFGRRVALPEVRDLSAFPIYYFVEYRCGSSAFWYDSLQFLIAGVAAVCLVGV